MNGRNLLFAAMVLGAVGCAGQPVGTDIHAPVAATSVSARSDSGATSRLVRPIARDFGLRPVVVFCPHDGPRGQCRYHPEPGSSGIVLLRNAGRGALPYIPGILRRCRQYQSAGTAFHSLGA